MLRELEQSELSMAEFCRQRGLVYGAVAAWRCAARRNRSSFVEVEVDRTMAPAVNISTPGHSGLCAEVLLPGGAILRVFDHRGVPDGGGQP